MPAKTILLLQPAIGFMDSWRSAPSLPLGLLHAATFAAGEYRVAIFDQRFFRNWEKELLRVLKEAEPLLVGTTMYIGPSTANALRMLALVRGVSDVPTVAGGVLPSLEPELALSDPGIDYVVKGEGERALPALAGCIESGSAPDGAAGVWFKRENSTVKGPEAPLLDIENLPEIPYDILPVEKYLPSYGGEATFYMQTSRGCPMNCSYCFNPEFNRRAWRKQSSGRVAERIEYAARKFHFRNIYFVDDDFFVDMKRAIETAAVLARLRISWQVQGVGIPSLKKMTGGEMKTLKESGLKRITIGIESGSPAMRRLMRKNYSNDDIRDIISRLRDFGFVVFCSFMCNLPTETDEDIRQSVNLVFDLIKANPNFRASPFYSFVPSPGTDLFRTAVEHGFTPPATLGEWGDISFDCGKNIRFGARSARFYRGLYLATLFCDNKTREYASSAAMKIFSFLYRPIAILRLKKLFFKLMPEQDVFFRLIRSR